VALLEQHRDSDRDAYAMTQAETLTVSLETVEVEQERQVKVGSVATGGRPTAVDGSSVSIWAWHGNLN
jgi:hypothetical protein